MTQYGFLIDLSRCTGCNACVVSCKQWHGIAPGPEKWMRVYQWEKGAFPDIDLRVLPLMCFHCESPLCAEACPNGAISKEEKYGAVLVDPGKCTGARKCWEACPYGTPQFARDDPGVKMSKCNMCIDRLEQGLAPICVVSCSLRALEFGPLDELMEKFGRLAGQNRRISKDEAPCRIACPAGVNAQGYVNLLAEGKTHEALDLFRETTPFAGVLGRTCSHSCEVDCLRSRFDDAVSICALKRFMADAVSVEGDEKGSPLPTNKDKSVAVIGSGPAGLSCAYDLIRMGYPVTVFEAAARSGGLMRYGIPEYRLPEKVLDREIRFIEEMGVEIRTGTPVKDMEALFEEGYVAALVATGAWRSLKLGVPGEEAEGFEYAMEFLHRAKSEKTVDPGRRVAVIGGSVAVDAARTALRLGAQEVHLVCMESLNLQSKDRMLAQDKEIEEAREEGVVIHPCLGIKQILTKEGRVTGLEGRACLSVREEDGAFNPRFDECDLPAAIEADRVIVAIGQAIDPSTLPDGLDPSDMGTLHVNPITMQTADKRIFAGGDVTTGPLDIISAVSSGKEAAKSIDRYLRGEDLEKGRHIPAQSVRERVELKSLRPPVLEAEKRRDFAEVDLGFDREAAAEQASRCLKCGTLLPSVIIKRIDPKKQIVPWDLTRALELWKERHPDSGERLPDVFTEDSEVTRTPEPGLIGRNRLVLKPRNAEELMFYTTDDE